MIKVSAPWATLGTALHGDVDMTLSAMLQRAGLDWLVEPRPVFDRDGREIPRYRANTRVDTGVVLGIPTGRYRIVQNHELFTLVEGLLGESCVVRRAGQTGEGRMVWAVVEAATPYTIAGTLFTLELDVSNAHTGLNSFQVRLIPKLPNGAGLPVKVGRRVVYLRHTLNVANRLDAVRTTLELGDHYMAALESTAEKLLEAGDWGAMTRAWLPDEGRTNTRVEQARDLLPAAAAEHPEWEGTKWGFLAAAASVVAQLGPARATARSEERALEVWMEGSDWIDRALAVASK